MWICGWLVGLIGNITISAPNWVGAELGNRRRKNKENKEMKKQEHKKLKENRK